MTVSIPQFVSRAAFAVGLFCLSGGVSVTSANERAEGAKLVQAQAQAAGMRVKPNDGTECSCGQTAPTFSENPQRVVPIPPTAPNVVPESRGALVVSTWSALPGWNRDNPLDAWQGFLKSCTQLRSQIVWQIGRAHV